MFIEWRGPDSLTLLWNINQREKGSCRHVRWLLDCRWDWNGPRGQIPRKGDDVADVDPVGVLYDVKYFV